ncbi:MAG TPA: EAL domain-containing protein [Actinomycetota bacterium]|nr:EAL domain-containing protein [Actinomycetota bacterium]
MGTRTPTTRRAFARLRRYLRGEGLTMAFQPITELDTGKVLGFESLARFDGEPVRSPAAWFQDASAAGLRQQLELAAARAAIASLKYLPADAYLTINASPDVAMMPAFLELVGPAGPRLVVEITEHAPIADYDALNSALDRLRTHGVRVAIDDAGAGFANVSHLLRIEAEIIKLDIEITRDVDLDARRKAMVGSLVEFARSIGAILVAEGIETPAEMSALRRLGVQAGQGYHLGRPAPLQHAEEPRATRSPARRIVRKISESVSDSASSFAWKRRRRGSLAPRVALLLVGALLVGPAAYAYTENSTPGSPGYWVKRRVEDVRLLLALDRDSEIRLRMQFARRRLAELDRLVAEGETDATEMLLADYRKHIDSVERTLPSDPDVPEHVTRWVGREIADYVDALERDVADVCAAKGRPANDSCRPIERAARRSKTTLERISEGTPPAHASPQPHPSQEPSARPDPPAKGKKG